MGSDTAITLSKRRNITASRLAYLRKAGVALVQRWQVDMIGMFGELRGQAAVEIGLIAMTVDRVNSATLQFLPQALDNSQIEPGGVLERNDLAISEVFLKTKDFRPTITNMANHTLNSHRRKLLDKGGDNRLRAIITSATDQL